MSVGDHLGHFNEIRSQCLPNKILRWCVLVAARAAYTQIVRLKARTYWILYSLIAPYHSSLISNHTLPCLSSIHTTFIKGETTHV